MLRRLQWVETSIDADNLRALPEGWQKASNDYTFRYAHSQSNMKYLVKIGKLGGKAVVHGLGIGDDKVYSFDIAVKDYFSESSFPFAKSDGGDDQNSTALRNLFISEGRIQDLSALFKINILQRLIPGLHKEGYEESAQTSSTGSRDPAGREQERTEREDRGSRPRTDEPLPPAAQPRPFNDPLADGPRRPVPVGDFPPPDFEDEHQILRPGGRGGYPGERRPLNIGERDLYPPGLAPHDPLRIGGPLGGGVRGGGGMHPTFDDPLFGGDGGGYGGYNPRYVGPIESSREVYSQRQSTSRGTL